MRPFFADKTSIQTGKGDHQMTFSKTAAVVLCAGAIVLATGAQAAPRQVLLKHVPQAVRESRRVGPLASMARLNLAIGLPLRNAAELETVLNEVTDPSSPNYRQYLSASEFTERFGPTQEDYDKLIAFLEANGLTVSGKHPNRMILDVSGPVAAIDKTFHVNLMIWEHATRGRFFAPNTDPWLDVDVDVLDITGLDNFVLPKPMDVKVLPLATAAPMVTGSGPYGLFTGKDFRAAYAPGVTRTGAGQSIGLFELDGFYASDVQANFKQAGLPAVPVQTVLLDGFNGAPGSANIEVILDIMMAAYMAPGANIVVYEGYNWNDVLNRMATDNVAKQLSSSWCFSPINATTEQIFKQMIAQGQSLLQASGDSGAYHGWIMPPADDPNVTVVGGTALTTNGPGGTWLSETTWSGSGGGASTSYSIPSYQQNMNLAAIGGSNTMRNIPDVALTAAVQMFLIYNNGQITAVGGTSAAAPLWAGFLALANEQAAATGKPPAGFLNPTIYALGTSSTYATMMHDISTGSNGYSASAGYDLATGWGTPAGQSLINALTAMSPPSFTLSAAPGSVTVRAGSSATSTITITPKNGFSGNVTLSATGLPAGVTASFGPSTAAATSTLTLTATSAALAGAATVTVTGVAGSLTASAKLSLTVSTPGFTLAASPSSVSIMQGATGSTTLTLTPVNGFSGTANLAVSGLPIGVTAAFSPASLTSTGKLTLTVAASAPTGTAAATVTATSGSISAKTTVSVAVAAAPGFKLSAPASSVNVVAGGKGTVSITVQPQNGFTGTVALAASGLPAGLSASFNPASTASSSTLTITATTAAALKSSQFTVSGTSGSLIASLPFTVTVVPPPDFGITVAPANLTVVPGGKGAAAVLIAPLNGFAGNITLAASGLAAGVTTAFSPLANSGWFLATFSAVTSAAAGTTKVTVTATSGTLSHGAVLNLTVLGPPSGTAVVDLSPYYNVSASAVDNVPFTGGGLDGGGRSYSGMQLGASQSVAGAVFSLGPMGVTDAVSGVTASLPQGKFTTLRLLATGVNGNQPSQVFTVTYTDGTSSQFTQSLSDWYTPQNYAGETRAVTTAYRSNSTGTLDSRAFYLYAYSFSLNTAKTVKSVTLPQNRNVVVMAMTLGGAVH
jgi:hypothetical protein